MKERPVSKRSASSRSVPKRYALRNIGRLILGAFLLFAGISHLTVSRVAFRAQVPGWLPFDADFIVIASGIVEIALGLSLALLTRRQRFFGIAVAVFFLLVFPGNISQLLTHTNSFGLDSDISRGIRLLFQPVLVLWALWSTGVLGAWRDRRRADDAPPAIQKKTAH